MEGSFEGRVQASSATQVSQSSTSKSSRQRLNTREKSSIMMGDDSHEASTSKLHSTSKASRESRTSSLASSQQTSSVTKSNQSSAIAGAIVQTGKDEASISAVNTDKFASSLRESSAVAIGQQKEMSVIENHRKQSLQKQRNDNWDTRATGFSAVGEAHTGRTSAYGGRDYEYSANIASRGTSNSKQSGSWAAQENTGRNVGYSSKSSTSTSRQEHSSSASGMRQEQSAGYARQLGSSHSGAALIRSDHTASASTRHEASSSAAYQSTAQQSYKGQQNMSSESRVERTTPSRRKTWAESSILHSGVASNIGSTIYGQDFQQHTCPASKVYTTESPFRYERQTSSGHKMFQPKDHLNNTR